MDIVPTFNIRGRYDDYNQNSIENAQITTGVILSHPFSETSKRMTTETWRSSIPVMIVPVDGLEEIPGESRMGLYNLETGEINAG